MAKLVLLQFDTDPECAARRDALSSVGATIVEGEPRWPVFFDTVLRERPDAIVIAGSTLSEHAREAARYLGEGFNTRNIPVVLVDVPPKELELTREAAPRTIIVKRDELAQAAKKALSA
jgi:fructose-1-phosphate kinase PfkB-like protein